MVKGTTPREQASRDSSFLTARRTILRAFAGVGLASTLGIGGLARPVGAAIPGVEVEYKRCHVAFVSNASAIDTIAVYYADRDGARNARYDIVPTVTRPRGYTPLVVEYDADEDRTQIQLAEPRGALVCVIAEAGTDRTVRTNPTDRCVPEGFNTAPTASFTVSESPTVGEQMTFTSTATDPDSPERLSYAWDLDGDGTYETTGQQVTTVYATAGDRTVHHLVTDDCGASDTETQTIAVSTPQSGQVTKLVPARFSTGDQFGYSVATAGGLVAVGARNDDDAGGNAGAVYVYDLTDLSADPQKLVPDGLAAGDEFGFSVAMAGDTLAVGAYFDGDGGSAAGAVYVYDLTDLGAEPQKLVPDGIAAGDWFGFSVAVAGDSLAVGAPRDDEAGSGAGAAYVYDLSDLAAEPQKLVPGGLDAGDDFGWSVAAGGGFLAVGAPEDGAAGSAAGAVYVYDLSDLGAEPQKLVPDSLDEFDLLGWSVAVGGDTLAAGAYNSDEAGPNGGAVYVYDLTDLGAGPQTLVPGDLGGADRFGYSVAVAGDTVAVGAIRDDDAGSDAGTVYVYDLSDLGAGPEKLLPGGLGAGDQFGFSVAMAGATIVAGAWLDDEGGSDAGAVYVFQ